MKYYVLLETGEVGLEILHTEVGTIIRPVDDAANEGGRLIDFAPVHANLATGEGLYSIIADGKSYQLYVEPQESGFRMVVSRHRFDLEVLTEREWRLKKVAPRNAGHSGAMTIIAPMPGLVKGVLVASGDIVKKGQRLLVLEAMKMENDITSPTNGKITAVSVEAGAIVEGGKPLISLDAGEG